MAKAVRLDDETYGRLVKHVHDNTTGSTHGMIGKTVCNAVNYYIDKDIKY